MSESEEPQELIELITKFFKAEISPEYLQGRLESPTPSDSKLWSKLLDLGFFEYFEALTRDEDPFSLIGEIARKAGEVPLPESLCETLLAGPVLWSLLASASDRECLEGLLGGDIVTGRKTLLIAPPFSSRDLTITSKGEEHFISGTFSCIPIREDSLGIVFSHEDRVFVGILPEEKEREDISPASSLDRLLPRGILAIDHQPVVELSSVSADEWNTLHRFIIGSELLGIGERCLEMTRQYVIDRKQFGISVGCFQAVKHPLADAYLKMKEIEALHYFLKGMFVRQDAQRDVLSLVFLSATLFRVPAIIEKCIQLHGGIGFTWEYPLHQFLRRAKVLEVAFGLSEQQEHKIGAMSLAL